VGAQYSSPYDAVTLECADYQPIQAIKNPTPDEVESVEDAGCDSCIRYKNGQCKIYQSF
jgi:hypothetical protein